MSLSKERASRNTEFVYTSSIMELDPNKIIEKLPDWKLREQTVYWQKPTRRDTTEFFLETPQDNLRIFFGKKSSSVYMNFYEIPDSNIQIPEVTSVMVKKDDVRSKLVFQGENISCSISRHESMKPYLYTVQLSSNHDKENNFLAQFRFQDL